MNKLIIFLFLSLFIFSCDSVSVKKQELQDLKKEISEYKKVTDSLKKSNDSLIALYKSIPLKILSGSPSRSKEEKTADSTKTGYKYSGEYAGIYTDPFLKSYEYASVRDLGNNIFFVCATRNDKNFNFICTEFNSLKSNSKKYIFTFTTKSIDDFLYVINDNLKSSKTMTLSLEDNKKDSKPKKGEE